MAGGEEVSPPGNTTQRLARAALLLAVGAALVLLGHYFLGDWTDVFRRVESPGPWAAVAFVGTCAAATVAWIPGSVLTLARGPSSGS